MWIFGYGSLLWRPNFTYQIVVPGIVKGYSRRFWQLSPDHRGNPSNPGRVVNLVSEPNSVCWGLAYKIPENDVEATRAYLDHREQAGYELQTVEFHPDDGSPTFELEVYISTAHPENIYYEPTASIDEIVETIVSSHGQSGSNIEYALRLAEVHRRFASHVLDEHLFEIERRILKLCEARRITDKVLLNYKLSYAATS
ncbi:Gamma-glutamylcyclotransferase [Aphelenchoides bicaudatus]|nr:Gamma-glutamylcyclotransferase [Aphelenchoides bicaudatus]